MKPWSRAILILLAVLVWASLWTACAGDDDDDDSGDDDDVGDDDAGDDDADDDDDDDDDDDVEPPPGPLSVRAMTYNVLFAFPNPDYDPWSARKQHVAEIINFHDPDLLGLQEPLSWQVDDLHELCPGYADYRLDLHTDSTLFYRADRFEFLDAGEFWLSPHPDIPFSIGFGNFFPRNALWIRLRDMESNREFFFVNTHFDNTAPFQENAAPMFLDLIEAIASGAPLVVTGDFNSKPDREAYRILTDGNTPGGFALTNSFDLADGFDVRLAQGDQREYDPAHRIDHIFVANRDWDCSAWVVDMTRYGDPLRDPSDHFAMAADVGFDQ